MRRVSRKGGLAAQLFGDPGDVAAPEARAFEFRLGRHAGTVPAGDGGRAVGRAAGDLVDAHLRRVGIRQADHDHALVQQGLDEGHERGFLTAVLGGCGTKHPAGLADEAAAHPDLAGGVQELAHLPAHVAEAGRRAENDGVGVLELLQGAHRHRGQGLLRLGRMHFFEDIVRERFRDAAQRRDHARHLMHAFGHGLGHGGHVAVERIIDDQHIHKPVLR